MLGSSDSGNSEAHVSFTFLTALLRLRRNMVGGFCYTARRSSSMRLSRTLPSRAAIPTCAATFYMGCAPAQGRAK
eukprot:1849231-Pleurochrysis_carterae.AAC.3